MLSLPSSKLMFIILETRLCHSSIVTICQHDIVNLKLVVHLQDIELVFFTFVIYVYLVFLLDNAKLWPQSSSKRGISPKLNKYTHFKSNAYHNSTLLLLQKKMKDHPLDAKNSMEQNSKTRHVSIIQCLQSSMSYNITQNWSQYIPLWVEPVKALVGWHLFTPPALWIPILHETN
jgi:hypothetical protein